MKNIVTISIQFYYKGEQHSPSVTIEMDELILATNNLSHFYPLLAKENNYDMYSYEFEMMQAEPLHFSNAEGLIADFISDNALDTDAFIAAWKKDLAIIQLSDIAEKTMNINNLKEHPELTDALLQAFELGQNNTK